MARGSTAYAIAEGAKWRDSLKDRPGRAPQFYFVLAAAFLLGLALNYLRFGVVAMLFWSAVVNGVLAPPLIALAVMMSSDRRVMGTDVSGGWLRWVGWLDSSRDYGAGGHRDVRYHGQFVGIAAWRVVGQPLWLRRPLRPPGSI